jgi:hypothetical protein
MRPPHLIYRLRIIQLDIQVLVHALQRPSYLHFVLEFNGNFVLDERFEEARSYGSAVLRAWCGLVGAKVRLKRTSAPVYCIDYEPEEKHDVDVRVYEIINGHVSGRISGACDIFCRALSCVAGSFVSDEAPG